jgi:glucose/arabinose dehydrogenase
MQNATHSPPSPISLMRDVRQGPDGLLYALVDDEYGAILRIEPAG